MNIKLKSIIIKNIIHKLKHIKNYNVWYRLFMNELNKPLLSNLSKCKLNPNNINYYIVGCEFEYNSNSKWFIWYPNK